MPEQRRKNLRLPVESNTFIELVAPDINETDSGTVIACKSLNVSRKGLQVALGEEVTLGAFLQIGVDLPDSDSTLYLVGEVCWCLPAKQQSTAWVAGFRLHKADNSDIERWIKLISSMEH